ncbi:hypothetical protein D3C81_2195470 [compost metagenome]
MAEGKPVRVDRAYPLILHRYDFLAFVRVVDASLCGVAIDLGNGQQAFYLRGETEGGVAG